MRFAPREVSGKFALYRWNRIIVALLALTVSAAVTTTAQTYTVLHTFSGGGDGGFPSTGLTPGPARSFYGTTHRSQGGLGTVFKLKPVALGWILNTLYRFQGGSDGDGPLGRVSVATDGTLYGSTFAGGAGYGVCNGGCGTIYHLTPGVTVPLTALSLWNETVLYRFQGAGDGGGPRGDLLIDALGNLYGTGYYPGAVFELMSNGWAQSVLYSPGNYNAIGGMISDAAGNLYGVSTLGGDYSMGAVYELSPSPSGWTMQTLYSFTGQLDGYTPEGGLIMDSAGNLYGTTAYASGGYNGTVFELSPVGDGTWTFQTLCDLPVIVTGVPTGPVDKLAMDAAGNLYGTTYYGGSSGVGTVFELMPSNGAWTYALLHDFTGGADGGFPASNIVFDASGNMYGTASGGGTGFGVVFEITPSRR